MWEMIKNDPLLKSITVLILGVLSFGLAFNIMFGRNTAGMEGGMGMGGGYSLANTLTYILTIAIKLLFIGLVIAAIILLVKLVKRHLIEGIKFKMSESIKGESIKNDPVLKTGLIVVASVLVLGFIVIIFNSVFSPYNGYRMMTGGYISPMGSIALIFGKLLLSVSILGLIIALVAHVRQGGISVEMKKLIPSKNTSSIMIQCEACDYVTDQEYKYCPSCGKQRIKECVHCGATLKEIWKCCPNCGTETCATDDENSSLLVAMEETAIEDEVVDNTDLIVTIEDNSKQQSSYQNKKKKQR